MLYRAVACGLIFALVLLTLFTLIDENPKTSASSRRRRMWRGPSSDVNDTGSTLTSNAENSTSNSSRRTVSSLCAPIRQSPPRLPEGAAIRLREYVDSYPQLNQYVVVLTSHGQGNRMVSIMAAFLIALLTNRRFLVDWPNLERLYTTPFVTSSGERFHWGLASSNVTWTRSEEARLNLYENTHSTPFWDILACGNLEQFNTTRMIVVGGNQYAAGVLRWNPRYRAIIDSWFPPETQLFGSILRWLFRPVPELQRRVDAYFEENFTSFTIGMHVRVGNTHSAYEDERFERCIKYLYPDFMANNCSRLYVATMWNETIDFFEKRYPGRVLNGDTKGRKELFYDGRTNGEQFLDNNWNGAVDMQLLALSTHLITPSVSTFSYSAVGFHGRNPTIVPFGILWDLSRWVNTPCYPSPSTEACAHVHAGNYGKTLQGVSCSATLNITEIGRGRTTQFC